MKIVLIAETLKRADLELHSIVEANSDDLDCYDHQSRFAIFKDGTFIKAFSINDETKMKIYNADQVFTTPECLEDMSMLFYLNRVTRSSCVPPSYLIQVLKD